MAYKAQSRGKLAQHNDALGSGDSLHFQGKQHPMVGESLREFKRRVKLLTGGSWFVSMDYRVTELAQHLAWSPFPGEAWQ